MKTSSVLVPVSVPPIELVVELVNGWGTVPRAAVGESALPFPRSVELAHVTDAELVLLADALYAVFSATDDGVLSARLNELLADAAPLPQVATAGGHFDAGWAVAAAAAQLRAGCALALRQHLIEQGGEHRLGICSAARCADAYADHSAGGRRRFCSVACQTRTRVAAFRARQRTT